jgi:hypothetical protein
MGRHRSTTRLIAALGLAVLLLGAVAVWITSRGLHPIWREEPVSERVLRQAKERLGPGAEVQLIEQGRGSVVCGYVAATWGGPAMAFISRPYRFLLSEDPLSAEFRTMVAADCPTLPRPPAAIAVP